MAPAKKKQADPMDEIAEQIVSAIRDGHMDGYLVEIDDALTERMNAGSASETGGPKGTTKPKTVAPPPKKNNAKAAATITPVKGSEYVISDEFKRLAGAVVEFLRFKSDDDSKSVVSMVTEKPGAPQGKRMVVPTNVLRAKPAARSASRKVVRKK